MIPYYGIHERHANSLCDRDTMMSILDEVRFTDFMDKDRLPLIGSEAQEGTYPSFAQMGFKWMEVLVKVIGALDGANNFIDGNILNASQTFRIQSCCSAGNETSWAVLSVEEFRQPGISYGAAA
jgi:hypothetical protein